LHIFLFSLLHRACCWITQLLYQLLHIYKILYMCSGWYNNWVSRVAYLLCAICNIKLDALLLRNFASALSQFELQQWSTYQHGAKHRFGNCLIYVIMDWRDKSRSTAPEKKIAQLQSWKKFYSCILCYDLRAMYFIGELEKRAFRAWAYVDQFIYVCDCVTGCYRLRPKIWTMLSKFEIRSWFISKLLTLCVGKCSPSVIYVSAASLCQPLRQSLMKN